MIEHVFDHNLDWVENFLDRNEKHQYKWEKMDDFDNAGDCRWDLYVVTTSGHNPTKKWLSIQKVQNKKENTVCYKVIAKTRFDRGDLISLTDNKNGEVNQSKQPEGDTIGLGGDWIRRASIEDLENNLKTVNALITNGGSAIRAVRRIFPGSEIICTHFHPKCNSWWDVTWMGTLVWDNHGCLGRKKNIGRITGYSKSSDTFSVRFENGIVKAMRTDEVKEKALVLNTQFNQHSITHQCVPVIPPNTKKRARLFEKTEN